MLLRDVIAPDGRIYLKSEWGPLSDLWPAVSFSKTSVGRRLQTDFNPVRDVILYVGTGGEMTEKPEHRRRILSATKIEPKAILSTSRLVPAESWARAQASFKGRWEYSMPVLQAWDIPDKPVAPDIIPATYRLLGTLQALGNVVEVQPHERHKLLDLNLVPLHLNIQDAGTSFDAARDAINMEAELRNAIGRMVANIKERVAASGTASTRINPVRFAESGLHLTLHRKWKEQQGNCALCGGAVELESDNDMLVCSPDRIDSSRPWYDEQNLQITHRACNWAKNEFTTQQFLEWLEVVRSTEPTVA
jgi:hypothetical protein